MGFKTNTDDIVKQLNKKLNKMGSSGIPMAAGMTLNNLAFESRRISIGLFEKDRVIRSNWTKRGMLFQKTKTKIPIRQMESRSGNIREYGDLQETGGTVRPDGQFLPVPALAARGGNKKRRIVKKFKMNKLGGLRRMPSVGGSPTRRFAAMLNLARKEKQYGPFLVTDKDAGSDRLPRGIFELRGQGRGRHGGGKIKMIRKFKDVVAVPGNSYVRAAAQILGRSANAMDKRYIKNAKRVLKRFGRNVK